MGAAMTKDRFNDRAIEIAASANGLLATLKFRSNAARRDSVVAVFDGADQGARDVYEELLKFAPGSDFPRAIPEETIQSVVCLYARLEQCAASVGYALCSPLDSNPSRGDIRVATFTGGVAFVTTHIWSES